MLPETRRLGGFTRFEIGFTLILVTFVVLLAITKFRDLSELVDGSMDQGVVEAVQQGISAYARQYREEGGNTPPYPSVLDEADIGDATPQNLFFVHVLPKGIAVAAWSKTGRHAYRAPSGQRYVYDPLAGSFDAQDNATDNSQDSPAPRE